MKFKYLSAALLLSLSASACDKDSSDKNELITLLHDAKTLNDVKVTVAEESSAGIICVHEDSKGKFTYIPGKVFNPDLTGDLSKEQTKIFKKFKKSKEASKLTYSYHGKKKVGYSARKFGSDICAYVRPHVKPAKK